MQAVAAEAFTGTLHTAAAQHTAGEWDLSNDLKQRQEVYLRQGGHALLPLKQFLRHRLQQMPAPQPAQLHLAPRLTHPLQSWTPLCLPPVHMNAAVNHLFT